MKKFILQKSFFRELKDNYRQKEIFAYNVSDKS